MISSTISSWQPSETSTWLCSIHGRSSHGKHCSCVRVGHAYVCYDVPRPNASLGTFHRTPWWKQRKRSWILGIWVQSFQVLCAPLQDLMGERRTCWQEVSSEPILVPQHYGCATSASSTCQMVFLGSFIKFVYQLFSLWIVRYWTTTFLIIE